MALEKKKYWNPRKQLNKYVFNVVRNRSSCIGCTFFWFMIVRIRRLLFVYCCMWGCNPVVSLKTMATIEKVLPPLWLLGWNRVTKMYGPWNFRIPKRNHVCILSRNPADNGHLHDNTMYTCMYIYIYTFMYTHICVGVLIFGNMLVA